MTHDFCPLGACGKSELAEPWSRKYSETLASNIDVFRGEYLVVGKQPWERADTCILNEA